MSTPEQLTIGDLATAPREAVRARAAVGMTSALHADRVQAWKLGAEAWLADLEPGAEVTADDVVLAIGLPDHGPARNNVVGAWFGAQARAGRLAFTGRTRSSKRRIGNGNQQRVWRVT